MIRIEERYTDGSADVLAYVATEQEARDTVAWYANQYSAEGRTRAYHVTEFIAVTHSEEDMDRVIYRRTAERQEG